MVMPLGKSQMNDENGQAAYDVGVAANKLVFGKDMLGLEVANNNLLGSNVLKTDLGLFNQPSSLMFADDLDDRTRDRLISHTREDVAAAYAHAKSAFQAAYAAKEDARRIRRLVKWLVFFAIIQIFLSSVIVLVIA